MKWYIPQEVLNQHTVELIKVFLGKLFVGIYKVNNNSIIFGYSKIGEQVNGIVALIEINMVKIVYI